MPWFTTSNRNPGLTSLSRCPMLALVYYVAVQLQKACIFKHAGLAFSSLLLCKINIHTSASSRPWEVRLTDETRLFFDWCFLVWGWQFGDIMFPYIQTHDCTHTHWYTHKCVLSGEDLVGCERLYCQKIYCDCGRSSFRGIGQGNVLRKGLYGER